MGRCLFVSSHFPDIGAMYAGHKTAYKILKEYVKTCEQVDLIIICNREEINKEVLKGVNNVSFKLIFPLTCKDKLLNIVKSRRIFPLKVMTRFSRGILNFFERNVYLYDVIHFEFSHSAYPLLYFDDNFWNGKKIVVSCHDILVQASLRRKFSMLNAIDIYFTFRYEEKIFSRATKILVQNLKDRNLLVGLYGICEKKIKIVEPYISDFVYKARELKEKVRPENVLLFWGAMDREENVEAIVEFVRKYKELIREKDYRVYVVGANPAWRVVELHDGENIIVTGFVKDPTKYFVKAKYGIVPLLRGAGVKVKTLEMLKAGLKVISTPVGAEGIEHNNLIVEEISNWRIVLENVL